MSFHFTVLASGSSGNASLVQSGDFSLLLDVGLGPRQLASRLAAVGATWRQVGAVLLTHTHTDHWNENTFALMRRHGIPLHCHTAHAEVLATASPAFAGLQTDGLVCHYGPDADVPLTPRFQARPLPVSHDGGPTFGFRLEGPPDLFGQRWALGYVADLGCWTPALVEALADVDLLALEFNHDVDMELTSGRSPRLIARVLGNDGHLSNDQAAALLRGVLERSTPGRLCHVVQLHLSRQCNRPELAQQAAAEALAAADSTPAVHTASQHEPGPTLTLHSRANQQKRTTGRRNGRSKAGAVAWLPGLEV